MAEGGMFLASAGMNIVNTGMGAYNSVQQQKLETEYKRGQLKLAQQMADFQAEDAIKRGESAVAAHRTKTKALIGSQRAALAAQGVDIASGSAAEVQADTAALSAADELVIRNNAYREAFGYRAQSNIWGNEAAFAGIASAYNQRSTILTAGMQMFSQGLQGIAQASAFSGGAKAPGLSSGLSQPTRTVVPRAGGSERYHGK